MLIHHQEEKEVTLYAENFRCLEIKKELELTVEAKHCTIWPSLGHKSLQ